MKKPISLFACILIVLVLIYYRTHYFGFQSPDTFKVTTWDALGYYLYLPSTFIYHDVRDLSWFDEIDKKYHLSGGKIYQFSRYKNGNHVFKYYAGVACIEAPFFFIGHCIAKTFNYDADGFSAPYQYSITIGILIWFISSIFLLRYILLKFFHDLTVSVTLVLLILATNAINYTAIEPAQSHGPIFPLYVLVLIGTIKWHQNPGIFWASFTGFIIGFATMCRPTEAIMFLIPLLWNTQDKATSREKWNLVMVNRSHVYYAVFFGFIGIFPQLLYWKHVTGSFIYNVGSAWDFLTPHLRVITGWEKGWFIYTPVTIFFIIGMFFLRNYPFRKAVLYFCLINIYIIISWRVWRYGGSYSTRALMHSYPVFALSFGAFIERINQTRWRYIFYFLGVYLLFVNLFQIRQYYNTILHYDGMNRKYYCRVYLNNRPTSLDMSLLDTKEWIRNEDNYVKNVILNQDSTIDFKIPADSVQVLAEIDIDHDTFNDLNKKKYLKIETSILINTGLSGSYLNSDLCEGDSVKHSGIRLFNPISQMGHYNYYAFYMFVPAYFKESRMKLYITSQSEMEGKIKTVKISSLTKE
jgi:hypothetical protein